METASFGRTGHGSSRVIFGAAALGAIVIRCAVAGRNIDHAEVGIDDGMSPNRCAAMCPGRSFPGIVAEEHHVCGAAIFAEPHR